jgi:hypothetical protein
MCVVLKKMFVINNTHSKIFQHVVWQQNLIVP